jgi:ABC-2 type transport system ATP-binding protein
MQDFLGYHTVGSGFDASYGQSAIRTEGLVRRFGPTVALAGLDLVVHRGEIYGFLGPNGAGKSSLIRVLCTLLRPSAGRAIVAGHDVVEDPQAVRMSMGVALQETALDDRQTGRELLTLQARLYGLGPTERSRRLAEVLDLVDIAEAIDRRVGTYSGGMKRRLDLAAALIHNPEVVFLDEPTTGLDPAARAHVWEEVRRLNAELGITIFLTTQYLEEADALADRVGIITAGRLVAEGRPGELKRSLGAERIVIETTGHASGVIDQLHVLDQVTAVTTDGQTIIVTTADASATLGPLAIELARCDLRIQSLSVRTPTLEDVFRQITGTKREEAVIGR